MVPVAETTQLISREPTVRERKKAFRLKVTEMFIRKMRNKYTHDINITSDQGLRMVRDGAVARSSIGHATLIERLRQERIARSHIRTSNEN